MKHRTLRACQDCGKEFQGSGDAHYCPECAKKRKSNVVRIRVCADCGAEFPGGPRAKRCPSCADIARRAYRRQHKTMRPLGSIDKCEWCGQEYAVNGGRQKYCSPECMHQAVLQWQRERKKEYNIESGQDIKKQERRIAQKKVCIYCGRKFKTQSTSNLCSDYCRNEYIKLKACKYDVMRGNNRDLQKYIDKMNEYRKK